MKAKLAMLTIAAALLTAPAVQAQPGEPAAGGDEKVTAWCPAMMGITVDSRAWPARGLEGPRHLGTICKAAAQKVLAQMPGAAGRVESGITPLAPFASEKDVQKSYEMLAAEMAGFRGGPQPVSELTVILSKGGRAEAEQVLREAARRVERLADEMTENYRNVSASSQKAAEVRLRRAEQRLAEAARRSAEGFRLKDGLLILDAQMLAMQVNELQSQGQKTLLLLEGKKARLDAVQRQIATIAPEAGKKAQDDPVAKELREILRLQERALEAAVKHAKQGVVGPAEIDQQKINIARARAELAQRIEDGKEKFQGGVLAKLNAELATLAIDVAELEAKLKLTKSLLGELQKAQVHFSLRRRTRLEYGLAEKAYRDAYGERDRLLRQAQDVAEPKLTVWILDRPPGAEAPRTWRKLATRPAK